jgi:hypothetical protein
MCVQAELSGVPVAFTHGHKVTGKEIDWLRGQSIKLLRDYNKEKVGNEYDMVLSQTVRVSKPGKYANKKNIVFKTDTVEYSLTAKQDFFLNEIRLMQRENKDACMKDVVQSFLEMKYINTTMSPTEMELKPAYHKKTINYLVKCGAIKQTAKNYYRTTF